MNTARIERMKNLFAEAQEQPPDQQAAFLARACPDDPSLRQEVAALLRCEEEDDGFLEEAAFGHGLELFKLAAAGKLQADDVVGDCRVLSLLGVGGMGEVYLAEDAVHGRKVALKLIGQSRSEDVRGRHFRHERKVLAALNHPHIARLYGSGTTPNGQAYLVMEYVEGERLDKFCEARKLGVTERLALFRKVCAAVAYAHQNLVVHRDLKPANIRVTAEGEPKLLDFGIAKLLDPEGTDVRLDPTLTMQGAMTPEYASPEQLKGEPITTATDVYSLGVVLYELLCGQRPFAHLKSRRPDELARAVCEEEPPRPSTVAGRPNSAPTTETRSAEPATKAATTKTWPATLRRQLEGDLDNIAAKALQKEPGRRYPSVLALSEDLRRHSEGLPVRARRDTLHYRASKFVRRHKAGVAAGALVAVALLVGLVVAIWQARVALRERDHAHVAQRQAERLNSFLQQLLSSVEPSHRGKDAKVSEVLDAAGRNLDHELAEEPEVLAQAHQTLAHAYRHLNLLVPAEQHARTALDLERRLHGPDDPATVRAETSLAKVLSNRFQWNELDPLLRHALVVLRRQPTLDEATLAEALRTLGYSRARQGNVDEAEPLLTQALFHARAAWGEQSADYISVLNDLANLKGVKWDYAAAESLYRRIIALQDQIAPGGEYAIAPLANLCIVLFNQEKLTETKQALDRFDRDVRRLFGEKSVYFAMAQDFRGIVDAAEGDYQAAIPLFREALPVLVAVFSSSDVTVVQCRAELGLCLTRTGQATEGEGLLRAALADGRQVDWQQFAHTVGNLETALGECLLAQQHYAEAEPLLLTGLADLDKRLGPQNRFALQARQRLHDLYVAWNKPTEAARYEVGPPAQVVPNP